MIQPSSAATSCAPPLTFYFDFVSPYAFIAWTQVHTIAVRHGRAVETIPVLFAGLLDAHETKGPAETPAKRAYIFRDAYRKAYRLGLPELRLTPSHPFNPLLALRVATCALPATADATAGRRLIDALYEATWVQGTGIETAEAVAAAAHRAGLDGMRCCVPRRSPSARRASEAMRRAACES